MKVHGTIHHFSGKSDGGKSYTEGKTPLYLCVVDLSKVYDSISGQAIDSCPERVQSATLIDGDLQGAAHWNPMPC